MQKWIKNVALFAIAGSLTVQAQQNAPEMEEERGRNMARRGDYYPRGLQTNGITNSNSSKAPKSSASPNSSKSAKSLKSSKSAKSPSVKARLASLEASDVRMQELCNAQQILIDNLKSVNDDFKVQIDNLKSVDDDYKVQIDIQIGDLERL